MLQTVSAQVPEFARQSVLLIQFSLLFPYGTTVSVRSFPSPPE